MIRPRILSLVICILTSGICYGQRVRIDSLLGLLPTIQSDKHKVIVLNDLSFTYYAIDPDSSYFYSRSALDLSDQIGFDSGRVSSNYYLSVSELARSNYNASISHALESVNLSVEYDYEKIFYPAYNLICLVYQKKGEFQKSLEYALLFKETCEHFSDDPQLINALNNLGNIYWEIRDTVNTIKYYSDAITLLNSLNADPVNEAGLRSNLAAAQPNSPDKLKLLRESIQRNSEYGFTNYLANDYYYLGDYYEAYEKDLFQAKQSFLNAVSYSESTQDIYLHARSELRLGGVYVELNQPDSGQFHIQKGLALAEQVELSGEKVTGLKQLAQIYFSQGKMERAYALLEESYRLRDEVFDTEVARNTSFANVQYETEKKESEIARQDLLIARQTNTRNLLIGGSIAGISLLSAIFFGFYQRVRRKRKETQLALSLEMQRAKDLEALDKVKTELFNNVSHELRTPLTMVIAPLQDATEKVKNIILKKHLNTALHNSRKLLNLTNEILDLSKIDAGKLIVEQKPVNLLSYLKRVYHSFESLAQSRNIRLTSSLDMDESISITTDIEKLEKILNNLISNAIKYSSHGGEVLLSVDGEALGDGTLSLSVTDYGQGIPATDVGMIFDRYFQSSSTSHPSGTGIGLALVKELCSLLQGHVKVSSTPGEGSTFTVNIPVGVSSLEQLKDVPEEVKSQKTTLPPLVFSGRKPHVLIVEDDLDMAEYLKALLETDYECDLAYNGIHALDMLNTSKYDLITSDIMMPEMDGFEFRKQVNLLEAYHNTPFIMLSARVLEEDKLKGFQLGIDDYITKPFSNAELKARVYNLLKNRLSRMEEGQGDQEIPFEEALVLNAKKIVLENMEDYSFSVSKFASALAYSNKQLGRILKRLTGLTPVEFILEVRLQRAYEMIRDRQYGTVNEVRYEVGIESASYFSSKFKERFGINPSEVM